MTKQASDGKTTRPVLRGASVQNSDGRVVVPRPLDVGRLLADFGRLDEEARVTFLCVVAHNLTVEIRALLLDRPVPDSDLDRVWQINEILHQITSCVNPRKRRSAVGDMELVSAMIDDAQLYHLEAQIGRALASAAGNTIRAKKQIAAK